jgi:hypothetical protein
VPASVQTAALVSSGLAAVEPGVTHLVPISDKTDLKEQIKPVKSRAIQETLDSCGSYKSLIPEG